MRRVVITGCGAISALGHTAQSTWLGMREGKSAIAPLTQATLTQAALDNCKIKLAAEVKNFDPRAHFSETKLALLDRVSQFALLAAREAVTQSGLQIAGSALAQRAAVIIGTAVGGESTHDAQMQRLYADKSPRIHPLTIVRLMGSAPSSQVSIEFGIQGPCFSVNSACATSNHAIAQAFAMVQSGQVEVALAGGTEACITFGTLKAWEAMRIAADDACRPFSAGRKGLVLGEGAGVYVLESEAYARTRGAEILAELAGCGMSSDAADIVFPSASGCARAITAALKQAQLNPDAVHYINAHGTGTQANDATETEAIKLAFGTCAQTLSISSTKAVHGHALGAAGAIELIAALGALREGIIAPTAAFVAADPACDLDYTPNQARARRVDAALSNSFAFGGLNAVLALKRYR